MSQATRGRAEVDIQEGIALPYKDQEKQKAYQREWQRAPRQSNGVRVMMSQDRGVCQTKGHSTDKQLNGKGEGNDSPVPQLWQSRGGEWFKDANR